MYVHMMLAFHRIRRRLWWWWGCRLRRPEATFLFTSELQFNYCRAAPFSDARRTVCESLVKRFAASFQLDRAFSCSTTDFPPLAHLHNVCNTLFSRIKLNVDSFHRTSSAKSGHGRRMDSQAVDDKKKMVVLIFILRAAIFPTMLIQQNWGAHRLSTANLNKFTFEIKRKIFIWSFLTAIGKMENAAEKNLHLDEQETFSTRYGAVNAFRNLLQFVFFALWKRLLVLSRRDLLFMPTTLFGFKIFSWKL